MCGIAGIHRPHPGECDVATVGRMLARLERRGPDDEGVALERCAVLGHRRLAILDLSAAGHQPMVSHDGRFVVTLNGEIYNYRELISELGLAPGTLRSRSDTEVVLHAWQRWGPGALDRLVGQWAFAIYDRATDRLVLTRDRFGEKPLYYHAAPGRFTFASSLEALLESGSVARRLDRCAIGEYATLRYVVSPRTVIEGVRKLEGGHLLEVDADGSLAERTWYVHPFHRYPTASHDRHANAERFGELLERACTRCQASDRPVGLLLSDGIDSNALLATMPDLDSAVTCFTFRLRGGGADEVPEPVVAPGHDVVDIEVSRDELAGHFEEYCSSLTEPVGDMAAIATWEVIRSARSRATVFLCGHGGDEVLGGYRLSQDLIRLETLRRLSVLPPAWIHGAIRRYMNGAESLRERRDRMRAAAPAQVAGAARFLIDRPLPADDVLKLLGDERGGREAYLMTIDRLYAEGCDDATVLDNVQRVLLQTFLSANILSWADSVAMSSSAELRMPYLDRDLVDFVAHLPAAHRVPTWPGKANTKRVLRDWARSRLPARVVNRSKRGFQAGSLEGLLRAIPGPAAARVLDSMPVRRALPGLEGWLKQVPNDYGGGVSSLLWTLLVLATWCDARGIV